MAVERRIRTVLIVLMGTGLVALLLVLGTMWTSNTAQRDTERAVRSVSLLYLDELAGRREQVVAANLQKTITNIQAATELLGEADLSDEAHLQAFQERMQHLYGLETFAFVDENDTIYGLPDGQATIADYHFDHTSLEGAEVSILNLKTSEKKVAITIPVDIPFGDVTLTVCYVEIDMDAMLEGVSMRSGLGDATFCNIYTSGGVALSNTVLGGLAVEDNLLDAMRNAQFEDGYSYEGFINDFTQLRRGEVSFTYDGIRETLSYVPVEGTDWLLTYLIRESVISEQISSVSNGILVRSALQSSIIALVLLTMFAVIYRQIRRNAQLVLEKETSEAENRARREELEQRLALREQLDERERASRQQTRMIAALASDYWSVYYLDLDADEGVCYRAHADLDGAGLKEGERFRYLEGVTAYARQYVTEPYLDEFLSFIQPEAIIEGLRENQVISHRYVVSRHGKESFEAVRFARVQQTADDDQGIHEVSACFADVDGETRKALEQAEVLSDALKSAEQANRAKTAFLSSMSHEIRTPMNAIIGLDTIALSDPTTPERTRDYLEKIGDSAEHLLSLINDILDMSRIESGRMILKNEEFSFSKLLEAVNTMFSGQCEDRGLEYQCHINGTIDDYYIGDGMKLRQVLINILGNAVKFTPKGGRVELGVERKAHYEGQSTLCFTISDTGIGMSEDFLPHLYDAFAQEDASTTSKYGSSGLGMAITKNIVEMMNGRIEVKSAKGEGTTFIVTMTLADSHHEMVSDYDEVHLSDISVLVIDDDPVAREHAKLVLEEVGVSPETAASGEEALEIVQLRHARRTPFHLILVDWQMPEMDGVETTRKIRDAVGDESAIIILTAYRWDDVYDEAMKAGVDSFTPKPLFAATVLEEFRAAMRRKGIARMGRRKAELQGRRVLMAEDMQINSDIMKMVLSMRDIESELAVNGKEAVELFASHPQGYYDAILMDMRMPVMDGLEATREIRALDRPDAARIPIIALTANAFDEDVRRSLQAGLNAHLTKPVQPEALFETLESLIEDD